MLRLNPNVTAGLRGASGDPGAPPLAPAQTERGHGEKRVRTGETALVGLAAQERGNIQKVLLRVGGGVLGLRFEAGQGLLRRVGPGRFA